MAHYNASVDTLRPPDEIFAYLSDFSSTQEWDPGVIEAQRLGDAPIRKGTEFRLELMLDYPRLWSEAELARTASLEGDIPSALARISYDG